MYGVLMAPLWAGSACCPLNLVTPSGCKQALDRTAPLPAKQEAHPLLHACNTLLVAFMQEVDLAVIADMGTLQRLPGIVGQGEGHQSEEGQSLAGSSRVVAQLEAPRMTGIDNTLNLSTRASSDRPGA